MITQEEDLAKTTILIETQTREELRKLGIKGESYDDIIRRLMKFWRQSKDTPVSV
jgi:predicted CopG family antitoxin